MELRGTAIHKPAEFSKFIINTHTHTKRKESKHNPKDSHLITREESKRRRKETKTNKKRFKGIKKTKEWLINLHNSISEGNDEAQNLSDWQV